MMIVLTKAFQKNPSLSYVSKVLLGTLFVACSAQICIPFHPVPMTLQSAACLVIGLTCSPILTASILGAYLAEAALGLPVLSNFTGGMPHLFGTRGGYILAFLPLAWIASMARMVSEALLSKIIGCFLGMLVLYSVGVAWLSTFIGIEKALQLGLYPFLWEIPLYIAFSILSAHLFNHHSLRFMENV